MEYNTLFLVLSYNFKPLDHTTFRVNRRNAVKIYTKSYECLVIEQPKTIRLINDSVCVTRKDKSFCMVPLTVITAFVVER